MFFLLLESAIYPQWYSLQDKKDVSGSDDGDEEDDSDEESDDEEDEETPKVCSSFLKFC